MFIIFMDIATLATIEERAIKFFEIVKSKSQEGIGYSITNIKASWVPTFPDIVL
jgi:hypothetical protein